MHAFLLGERPFTCRFCDRSFARRFTLRKHERCHTGIDPFMHPFPNFIFIPRRGFLAALEHLHHNLSMLEIWMTNSKVLECYYIPTTTLLLICGFVICIGVVTQSKVLSRREVYRDPKSRKILDNGGPRLRKTS